MGFEIWKQKFITTINSKYIAGKLPLLHTILFLLEIATMSRLVAKFNSYYADRPVITMMLSNAVLGGIADTVAQTITSVRMAISRKSGSLINYEAMAIEVYELDRKNSQSQQEPTPTPRAQLLQFDFERLSRFIAYGFMMAPVQFKWFQFLSKTFPLTKKDGLGSVLKMVAFDQLVFAPIGIATFFIVMTVAEGGGRRAVSSKLRDMYMSTLKANYMVWPAVQIINFRLMPIQFQLPFVSTIGIAWTAYLSLSNAVEEPDTRTTPLSPNIRLP